MKEEYHKITQTRRLLVQRAKSLIVSVLKEKGQVSFRPEDFQNKEDFEELSNEDYPIVTQLCGKHDDPDICITDVYLGMNDTVYADGIDKDTGEWRKEFYVIDDQFHYILQFIAIVLYWNQLEAKNKVAHDTNSIIMEMASELAEKAMVDKYNKLPEEFMDGENYKEEYQDVFNELYNEYYDKIAALANFELV